MASTTSGSKLSMRRSLISIAPPGPMGIILYFSVSEKSGNSTFRRNPKCVADSQPNRGKTKVLQTQGSTGARDRFAQTLPRAFSRLARGGHCDPSQDHLVGGGHPRYSTCTQSPQMRGRDRGVTAVRGGPNLWRGAARGRSRPALWGRTDHHTIPILMTASKMLEDALGAPNRSPHHGGSVASPLTTATYLRRRPKPRRTRKSR